VIVAGDLVNRGPRPLECLRFVLDQQRRAGWLMTIGNHEEYVLHQAQPEAPRSGPFFDVHQASYWTYCHLRPHMAELQALPFELQLTAPDGKLIRITHASLCGTRDGIYPTTTDSELETKIGHEACSESASIHVHSRPNLFLVGHTHIPLIRRLNGTLVVNAGSAGLPFDGDPRPSYARLTWQRGAWQAEIARVDYDLAAAEGDIYASGYFAEAGALIPLVALELKLARAQLGGWADRYQKPALAGEISVAESVQRFLKIG
jgi:predicted phosphodiesterase